MCNKRLILVIIEAITVHCFGQRYGEALEVKLAGATLPEPLCDSTAVYDGTDSVYIFGG
jgi:hypothetical protein